MRITREFIEELKKRFTDYLLLFADEDEEIARNVQLKEQHTYKVCKEIIGLGERLQLDVHERRLAEIIALFHDIGRFEQYARYGTFVDARSENHAKAGVRVLQQRALLRGIDAATQNLICRTISYHNRAALPREETAQCLFYTKLLRDADKLDIWRVVTEYYGRKEPERNGAIELDLPDTPGYSQQVCDDILHRKIVAISHVHNLNDFKLLQIGWIFDINFAPTFAAIRSRRYLEKIQAVLPDTEQLRQLFSVVHDYLENHMFSTRKAVN